MSRIEMEEGEERCPICRKVNHPGAMKTCKHYIGFEWDGHISDMPEEITFLAGDVCELAQELSYKEIEKIVKSINFEYDAISNFTDALAGHNIKIIINYIFQPDYGKNAINFGMIGGSGQSWYHRKGPARWDEVRAVLQKLRDAAQEASKSRD